MARTNHKELLDAGVHFGHLKRKWNPNMSPYIFMERNGIHIIDLHKTVAKIEEAANAMKQIARTGKKILFVATKKQAKDIVTKRVKETNMPYITERWPGGMLTNFATIRKAVKKMDTIDKMATDGTFNTMSKRERLQMTRQREKLEKYLGSITDLTRLPAAIFVVDIMKEHIAVSEARKLNIPTFAIVDTNSDPRKVDYPIPANDDASKSIEKIVNVLIEAVKEGLAERRDEREKQIAIAQKEEKEKKAAEEKAAEEKARAADQSNEVDKGDEKKAAPKDEAVVKKTRPAGGRKRIAVKKPATKSTAKKEAEAAAK